METNQPSKQSTAKLITTIIVLVVILGLLFAYANTRQVRDDMNTEQPTEQEIIMEDTQVQEIQMQSSSDDVAAIEADLNSTNLDNLDQ
jgi:hypothetical protein